MDKSAAQHSGSAQPRPPDVETAPGGFLEGEPAVSRWNNEPHRFGNGLGNGSAQPRPPVVETAPDGYLEDEPAVSRWNNESYRFGDGLGNGSAQPRPPSVETASGGFMEGEPAVSRWHNEPYQFGDGLHNGSAQPRPPGDGANVMKSTDIDDLRRTPTSFRRASLDVDVSRGKSRKEHSIP